MLQNDHSNIKRFEKFEQKFEKKISGSTYGKVGYDYTRLAKLVWWVKYKK